MARPIPLPIPLNPEAMPDANPDGFGAAGIGAGKAVGFIVGASFTVGGLMAGCVVADPIPGEGKSFGLEKVRLNVSTASLTVSLIKGIGFNFEFITAANSGSDFSTSNPAEFLIENTSNGDIALTCAKLPCR